MLDEITLVIEASRLVIWLVVFSAPDLFNKISDGCQASVAVATNAAFILVLSIGPVFSCREEASCDWPLIEVVGALVDHCALLTACS
jgi:hypothetical protein